MDRGRVRLAVFLLLLKEDQVLLSQRANTGWQDGNFTLVSGHVEIDEPATVALVRESGEEAGIEIAADDFECVHVVHRLTESKFNYVDYFFLGTKFRGEPTNLEPGKCSALEWHSIDKLPENTIPYVQDVIVRVQSGKRGFYEYGWDQLS